MWYNSTNQNISLQNWILNTFTKLPWNGCCFVSVFTSQNQIFYPIFWKRICTSTFPHKFKPWTSCEFFLRVYVDSDNLEITVRSYSKNKLNIVQENCKWFKIMSDHIYTLLSYVKRSWLFNLLTSMLNED